MWHTSNAVTLTSLEYLAVTPGSTMSPDTATRPTCKTTESQVRTPTTLPCGYGLHQLVARLMVLAPQLGRRTMQQVTIWAAATYNYIVNESPSALNPTFIFVRCRQFIKAFFINEKSETFVSFQILQSKANLRISQKVHSPVILSQLGAILLQSKK